MKMYQNAERNLMEETQSVEISSLRRLLNQYDAFFNFIQSNGMWYRWGGGEYAITSIDTMGETLTRYLCSFCEEQNIMYGKNDKPQRVLLLQYKDEYYMFRTVDGKDEMGAVSAVKYTYNIRVISWERLNRYVEDRLKMLMGENVINLISAEEAPNMSFLRK